MLTATVLEIAVVPTRLGEVATRREGDIIGEKKVFDRCREKRAGKHKRFVRLF
jgi:hypothetical protein